MQVPWHGPNRKARRLTAFSSPFLALRFLDTWPFLSRGFSTFFDSRMIAQGRESPFAVVRRRNGYFLVTP